MASAGSTRKAMRMAITLAIRAALSVDPAAAIGG